MGNHRRKKHSAHGWVRALTFFVIYLAVMSVGGLLYEMHGAKASPFFSISTLLTCTSLCGIVLSFAFRIWADRRSIVSMGFYRTGMLSDSVSGLLLAIFIVCAGASLIYAFHGIIWLQAHVSATLFSACVLLALVAASEEIVFRGYILRNLMKSFRRRLSLVISSLLFTFVHLLNPGIPAIGVINIFLGGLVLGTLFLRTKNLWAPMFFHFAWNVLQGPILGFDVSGFPFNPVLTPEITGRDWLSGGAFGFEGSVICSGLLLLTILFLSRTTRITPATENPDGADLPD